MCQPKQNHKQMNRNLQLDPFKYCICERQRSEKSNIFNQLMVTMYLKYTVSAISSTLKILPN